MDHLCYPHQTNLKIRVITPKWLMRQQIIGTKVQGSPNLAYANLHENGKEN
jgi:hypothetical protein